MIERIPPEGITADGSDLYKPMIDPHDVPTFIEKLSRAKPDYQYKMLKYAIDVAFANKFIDRDQQTRMLRLYVVGAPLDLADEFRPAGHDFIIEHVNDGLTISCRMGQDSERVWAETEAMARVACGLKCMMELPRVRD